MESRRRIVIAGAGVVLAAALGAAAQEKAVPIPPGCHPGNGGLTLPDGFCASTFADDLGHPRHVAVAPNGDVFVNTWSSKYSELQNAPGGYVVALRDADGDGRAETV